MPRQHTWRLHSRPQLQTHLCRGLLLGNLAPWWSTQVFGENVINLRNGDTVGAWHGLAARMVTQGGVDVPVTCLADAEELLRAGEAHKRLAATEMNERSSRAHTLVLLTLRQEVVATGRVLTSQLCLVDLGGSEQTKKSGVVGERFNEAVQINLGLLSLKRCITALIEGHGHVPFFESRLTSILKGPLEGKSGR